MENQYFIPFRFPLPIDNPRPIVLGVVGDEMCVFNGVLTGTSSVNAKINNRVCTDYYGNRTVTRVVGFAEINYKRTVKRTQQLKKGLIFKIEVKKDI